MLLLDCFPAAGFIKTVIRVLRCVGHYNSKLLIDKVRTAAD